MTIGQFLKKKVFENNNFFIDGWSFLHFAIFFIAGIIFPNRWGSIIIVIVLFELFEKSTSKRVNLFRETKKDTFTDIVLNLLGYFLGQQYLLKFGGF